MVPVAKYGPRSKAHKGAKQKGETSERGITTTAAAQTSIVVRGDDDDVNDDENDDNGDAKVAVGSTATTRTWMTKRHFARYSWRESEVYRSISIASRRQ